jgi:hypothetical protein
MWRRSSGTSAATTSKYTPGSELREKSREVVGAIIAANSKVEKLPFLALRCGQA